MEKLRDRVERLLRLPAKQSTERIQLPLGLSGNTHPENAVDHPTKCIAEFLDFLSDALPDGGVYLFGGVLRDLALFGRRGFNSDIDLVVEGDWQHCVPYLESLGANKNKFGGYRFSVAGWPIDIWNAEETWAIRQGLVQYRGIASLTETTVLNWDAILMNWRTGVFVLRENYLEEIRTRVLHIVLEENPNPLGMVVRVLRHLCSKDARHISTSAAQYLAICTKSFSYDDINAEEIRSYGNRVIDPRVYRFFEHVDPRRDLDIQQRFSLASRSLQEELGLDQD